MEGRAPRVPFTAAAGGLSLGVVELRPPCLSDCAKQALARVLFAHSIDAN